MRASNASRTAVLALAAALALLAGPARADHDVKVASDPKVGKHLTDAKGMTLYVFKKDSPSKSACSGPCLEQWPAYHREKVQATDGVDPKAFSTISREDGKKQTAYKGQPLYYFAGDRAPGDVNGEGFKDVWSVAKP